MKALVEIRYEGPPHPLIQEVDAFNVDRLLSRTGRGSFAFDVVMDGLHRHVLKHGRMVVIKSTTGVLPYVGRISHIEQDAASGVAEVSGDNYGSVLYGMALNRTTPMRNGGAGRIAARLLEEAQGMGRSVSIRSAVTTGTQLLDTIDFGSQHLGAALDALAKRVDDEWWIEHAVTRRTVTHSLRWEKRRGIVRRDIVLTEGVHFTASEYKADALGTVRSAVAVGGRGPIDGRPSVVVANSPAGAVGKAGQVEPRPVVVKPLSPLVARDVIVHRPLDTNETVLAQVARRALERPTVAEETLKFTVVAGVWPHLYPGNWYRARWHSLNFGGLDRFVRIGAMQPDETTGEGDVVLEDVA